MFVAGDHGIGIVSACIVLQPGFHLCNQPGLFFGIAERGAQSVALAIGLRHQLRDAGAGGGVDVLVLGNVQSFGAGLFNRREHLLALPPSRFAGELDVRNLRADPGFPGDAKDLR